MLLRTLKFLYENSNYNYYMSEGCAYFAIALHEMFGYQMSILWDEGSYYNEDEEIPTLAHVFCIDQVGKRAIDVKGVRSINDIKKDFYDLEEPNISPTSLSELKQYMNDSDNYPLMPYSEEEIKMTKQIIQSNMSLYQI